MPVSKQQETKPKKRIWPTLITLTIIALLLAFAISLMPRSIPTDFTVVGKGTNAVVLIYDPNILRSTQVASAMNAVRDEYKGQLEFVVVQLGSPTGRMLSRTYDIETTALLFIDGKGSVLSIQQTSYDAATLRHHLNTVFKLGN